MIHRYKVFSKEKLLGEYYHTKNDNQSIEAIYEEITGERHRICIDLINRVVYYDLSARPYKLENILDIIHMNIK